MARQGSRVPLVVAAVVGIAAVLLVRSLTSGGGGSTQAGGEAAVPSDCVALHVTASSEKAALLSAIALDYAKEDGKTDDGTCVRVLVTSKSSGGTTEALGRGWDEAVDGPRPDVWSPASAAGAACCGSAPRRATPPTSSATASCPRSPARRWSSRCRSRWPRRWAGRPRRSAGPTSWRWPATPSGWGAFGKPYGAFKLGKTNPELLHLGPERHDRRLLRRDRAVERPAGWPTSPSPPVRPT